MKHLNLTLVGGMPLELDDLEWEQKGIHDTFKGIVNAFHRNAITDTDDPYVLSGIHMTEGSAPGLWNISPGAIVFGGVVYIYPGVTDQSLPGGPEVWGLTPATENDPSGEEVFEDLVARNAYVKDAVSIASETPTPPAGFWRFGGWGQRIEDRIRQIVAVEEPGAWNIVNELGQPELQNAFNHGSGNDRVMFRQEPNGIVRLRGELRGESVAGTGSVLAFTLPEGYRPTGTIRVAVAKASASAIEQRVITIQSNGQVHVQFLTAAEANDRFRLDAISTFFAAS